VQRLFDAVFGVAFLFYFLNDKASLFGELNTFAKAVGYIKIAGRLLESAAK
jgi:hypothetical protein